MEWDFIYVYDIYIYIYIYTVWINLMFDFSTTTMLSVPGSHWLCWLILNHGMVIQGHLSQDSIYISFTIRIYLALKDTILLYHCRVAGYFWMCIHRVKCRKPNIYILCEYPSLSISLFYSLSIIHTYIYIYIIVQYTYVCIYRPKSCSVFSQSPAFQGLGAADRDCLEIGSTQLRRDVAWFLWEDGPEGRVPLNPLVKWLFEGQYIH